MTTSFFFLFGLIIGSFLNVVIYRLQTEETLTGRSHCRQCRRIIAWHDNIPVVSFALLQGKCRHCGENISWQYPLVELATALVFVLVGRFFFSPFDMESWITAVFYLGLFSILIVIFAHDLLTMYIPMIMIWLGIVWTIAYLVLSQRLIAGDFESVFWLSLMPYVLSGMGAFFFFASMVWISKETWMGMGDAYLALLAGLVTGWPLILWTLTLSFTLGAVIGLGLVVFEKKGMKSQVPFAPFLVTGTIGAIFLVYSFPFITF